MTELRSNIRDLKSEIRNLKNLAIEDYVNRQLYENPRFHNPKRLNRYESQVYSQNGEDGIIAEIFRRINTKNRFFVDFGVGYGLENNTVFLLVKGWTGYWIESNEKYVEHIKQKFDFLINKKTLLVKHAFVTAENIETLFEESNVPREFDLLSIDIDGNDYWIWKAIKNYHPRAVVIEYNALFPQDVKWIMKYNPKHVWNETCYQGASLKSLEILGSEKGYRLVGCDLRGINAFFVREDLVGDKFLEPFTAENHYEPMRYYLITKTGHRRDFGDFEK